MNSQAQQKSLRPNAAPEDGCGVLTAEALSRAIADNIIGQRDPAPDWPGRALQPASLDLSLGDQAWRIRASFLAGRDHTVRQRLDGGLAMHRLDLRHGAVLEKGCAYLVKLREHLRLPKNISALANPKSSTGRLDVFVRLVVDRGTRFEEVPAGYEGPLYAEISPRTFSIVVREGSSLNQLRLRNGRAPVDDATLRDIHQKTPIVDAGGMIDNGLGLTVHLQAKSGEIIGYSARRHAGVVDVDKVAALPWQDYWRPIEASRDGTLILDPDEFYILASREWLLVPSNLAAEMVPIDPLLGEYRVHYAGFFDPGFGLQAAGGAGSRAVLEVRGHDAPFMLEHGQMVARLVYERLTGTPNIIYGAGLSSHYQGQGLRLSKHFQQD